ncbi:hypothetical protein BCV70DRAFT_143909, partial [Testicularia cyperi]
SSSSLAANHADVSLDGTNLDDDGDGGGKRRRVQRACDTCRKKKVRCDGLQPEKGACSNCANYGYECTFIDAARKRPPPRSYIEAIETRIAKMEDLLATLAPGVDFTDRIGKPVRRPDDKTEDGQDPGRSDSQMEAAIKAEPQPIGLSCDLSGPGHHYTHAERIREMLSPSHNREQTCDTDDDSEDDIAFIGAGLSATRIGSGTEKRIHPDERFIVTKSDKLAVDEVAPQTHKFIGKASAMHLLPLVEKLSGRDKTDLGLYPKGARPEFWILPSGLMDAPGDVSLVMDLWPEPDLATSLLDAYFARLNHDFPMINEAQFRDEYGNKPELRKDPEWVARAFAVFMAASQHLLDDRTQADPKDPHSRGVHFWHAVKTLAWRNTPFERPLWRVQTMLLCTLFQMGTPVSASASWFLLGGAIRALLDIGAHRKPTARKLGLSRVDEESFKRVFWVAYSLDREVSAALGRPVMLQDEDIDLELPVAIDDYLLFNTPENQPLPEQPKESPAIITGFLCALRLDELIGRTLRMVYALHKTKLRFGAHGREWDERIVTEIDSALNNWLDTVPSHLRYDPHETNDEWLMQSSLLYSKYYNCQILVHRPFIPARKSGSETSILNFPSLAICTNASRSISNLICTLKERNLQNEAGIPIAFRSSSAAGILMMVIWGAKRNGGRVSSSASADLRRLIDVWKSMEHQWQVSGKLADIMESLIASTHAPVPTNLSVEQGHKRHRDGSEVQDDSISSQQSSPLSGNARPGDLNAFDTEEAQKQPRKVAGKKKSISAAKGASSDPVSRQLPLSTQQLANMAGGSSAEESPGSATDGPIWPPSGASGAPGAADMSQMGVPFGHYGMMTPQPFQRPRMPSLGGDSGLTGSMTFGMITPSAFGWAPGGMSQGSDFDYLQGPHSQANYQQPVPAMTPSIFDNLNLGPTMPSAGMGGDGGGMSGFADFSFGNPNTNGAGGNFGMPPVNSGVNYSEAQNSASHGSTPQSDAGIANIAFELLQKQSVWGLEDDYLSLLNRQKPRQ